MTAIYSEETRSGTLVFPNGRKLTIENVSEEQFKRFEERNAAEFARRDCILETTGVLEVTYE